MKNRHREILGIMMLLIFSFTTQSQTILFPVIYSGKMGYMDKTGKLIVPCQYDALDFSSFPQFSNGLISFRQNEKWGMLDATGKVAIQPIYAEKVYFTESDYAKVKISTMNELEKLSPMDRLLLKSKQSALPSVIIDKKGNSAFPGEYSGPVINGDILIYRKDDLSAIVNIRAKQEIVKRFSSIGDFKNGSAPARIEANGKYGLIDEKGNWLVQPQYPYIFHTGVNNLFNAAIEAATGKWALIDKSGKTMSGPFTDFKSVYGSWDRKGNLMPVRDKATNLLGYINPAGKLVIPCRYEETLGFSEGIAIVSEPVAGSANPEWKALDETGKVLFTIAGCAFGYLFQEGRCLVKLGNKNNISTWQDAILDTKGNFIIPPQAGLKLTHFTNGLGLFENEKGFGYYDLNGRVVWAASK